MFNRLFYIVLFFTCLQGCNSKEDTAIISDITEEDKIAVSKFFISVAIDDDLMLVSESLTNEYPSVVILKTLPSSHSLLVHSSIEDYELIRGSNYKFVLTDYYTYGETSDFYEITNWSRFYVSEDDSLQFKYEIDTLYTLMPNEEVEINLANNMIIGTVTNNISGDNGYRFVEVDFSISTGAGTFMTVSFSSRKIIGKVYLENESYAFEFEGDYGYVMPISELDYLRGTSEVD